MFQKLFSIGLVLALLFIGTSAFADWIPGDGHKMHWPQLPDEQGWDVNATFPANLSDDWRCSESGPVLDFHFWGSWRDFDGDQIGDVGNIEFFTIRIWSDIPADPASGAHSRPGDLLWEEAISVWAEVPIDPPQLIEHWFDPFNGDLLFNDHGDYFQYNIDLTTMPGIIPFDQVQGTIYWLNITAHLIDDPAVPAQWGWKSTVDHFNDDATFTLDGDWPGWTEMYEPPRYNEFAVAIDADGNFINGGGTNYYTDGLDENGWYRYPQFDWWNIWFYDNPFRLDHYKVADLDMIIEPVDPTAPSSVRIAVNFSTDAWSAQGLDRPPLPSDPAADETTNIGRMDVWTWSPSQGFLPPSGIQAQVPWTLSDYNPEWISIDVQGYNFQIRGNITHECVQTSLDLAFVITGGAPTGACCWDDGSCTIETQADCLNPLAGGTPGTYLGDGTICLGDNDGDGIDDACPAGPATGACCYQDGTCQDGLSAADCAATGGTYQGDGSLCLGDNDGDGIDDLCGGVILQGACCLQDGSCITTTANGCLPLGGTYLGDGSVCLGDADGNGVDDACETPAKKGACCWQDGSCSITTAANCVQNGGNYLGDNTACLGDADGNGVDDACETPDPDFKWEQLPDIEPTGFDVNATWAPNSPDGYVLADDFNCTVTGPITRIHVYGSWYLDYMPPNGPTDVRFTLSIHSDIPVDPADPNSYSRPGELLCLLPDLPFEVQPYATDLEEGWFNPPFQLQLGGDKVCWEYTFYLPPDVCIQEGTPSDPIVYWLDVQAYPSANLPGTPQALFGWKSSLEHWNDDGTWAFGQDIAGAALDWQELIYPPGHPMVDESVDLAFKIIGSSGTPTPTGACCWPDGSCTVETQIDCEHSPNGVVGTYLGDGSVCLGDANANGIDDACEDISPTGACCYDDPLAGPQCLNTTESNCIALGGAWYAGQDCNDPNFSCPNQPPQGACCWTDAAGNMNCTNTTQGECLGVYGGTWYLGQDCATFTCPDPQPLGACCYGPPASPSCVNTTEDLCKTVYNGNWYPGQDCATFDCPVLIGVPLGACCYDDPLAGPSCLNTTKKDCILGLGGTWYPGQNCNDPNFDCPGIVEPLGACCYGDPASPSCINSTQADCLALYGGTWYLGQDCATFTCPVPIELGACCYETAAGPACVDGVSQLTCQAQFGGNWYAGQTCATIDCPTSVPTGACCVELANFTSVCLTTTQADCLIGYGGTWYAGQACTDIDCPNIAGPTGACCYGDPANPSCADGLTEAECLAAYGGTWYMGQSCVNLVCPVPQDLGACCYGDPANPSCIDGISQAECEAQFGGNWYLGQTCATIDCPTTVELGACCYEIAGAAPGCVNTSQADCLQTYGGTWYAGQDCSTIDCNHQPPTGACCYGDPASPSCVNTTHAECLTAYGGTWYANTDCASFQCPVPHDLGACCIDGAAGPFCVDNTTQSVCEGSYGGIWHGGQACIDIDCNTSDPLGACCFEDAAGNQACANTTQANCTQSYGGTWYAGEDCATFQCEELGACCFELPPICANTTQSYCEQNLSGTWYAGQDCASFTCASDPTGACCWPDGSCTIVTQVDCEAPVGATPGTYLGDGSACLGDNNGNGTDDACEEPTWKWLQPPDLQPTGMDVRLNEPVILADDFLCTQPGDISEVSIWASWFHDEFPPGGTPGDVFFTLSMHTDVPATTGAVPVPDCPSGGDGWDLIDGLPAGTEISGHGELHSFDQMASQGGGNLGGSITTFTAILQLHLTSSGGAIGTFNRTLFVPVSVEVHTAPDQPGEDVQSFETEMVQLQGELFGDPDFCILRVEAGSAHGMPSFGETILTRLPSGDFQVDSFFDITYRIVFQGCPGSALDGMNGTTQGTVRMDTPEAGAGDCTTPNIGHHSYPGELLCLKTFDAHDFEWVEVPVTEEDWYDPLQDYYESPGDHNCIKYTFRFNPGECVQEGTAVDPIVYWLDVQAVVPAADVFIGWKTSVNHWNDDATWNQGVEPPTGPWQELRYPPNHPYYPQSLDFAFEIVGDADTCAGQLPGDFDGDGTVGTLADLAALQDHVYGGGPAAVPPSNGDWNGDCRVNSYDVAAMADYIAGFGAPPVDCTCLDPYGPCCQGTVGNVNLDPKDAVTIGDIAVLTNHLFIDRPLLECVTEADANQSGGPNPSQINPGSDITIGDVALLVDYLFITGPVEYGPLLDCF